MSFSEEKSKAFSRAAMKGDLPLVKSLSLDPKVDLNWIYPYDNSTPFILACKNYHVDIVRYFLEFPGDEKRGIHFDARDKVGWTAFNISCFHGFHPVVELLYADERIDVNLPNNDTETPVWSAAMQGHIKIVKWLLASGRTIDIGKRDQDLQKTPLEIAHMIGMRETAAVLEAYERAPKEVGVFLRRELGLSNDILAGELFALVVYLSDGYLKIRDDETDTEGMLLSCFSPDDGSSEVKIKAQKRFFSLAAQLPLDLQMVLCNRTFRLRTSIIKKTHSEEGFKKFAKEW